MSITWRQWYISYYFQFVQRLESISLHCYHWKSFHHFLSFFHGFRFPQPSRRRTNQSAILDTNFKKLPNICFRTTLAIHPSARAMLGRPSRALVPLVGFGMFIIRTKVLNAILCPYRQRYSLGLGCTRSQSHLEKAVEDDRHQHSRRCTCHRPDEFFL